MKTLLALATLALMSSGATAAQYGCNSIEGNWINASKTNCPPLSDNSRSERAAVSTPAPPSPPDPPEKECKDKGDDTQT